jgi:hypothetical protein
VRSPSTTMQQDERPLDSNDVSGLSCTNDIRRCLSNRPGIVMGSERVTRSDKFGYIYRYDISHVIDDERGGSYTCRFVFVVWTYDCKTWEFATHPMYQLPERNPV